MNKSEKESKNEVVLHVQYPDHPNLSEFTWLLESVNKGYYDFIREKNKISNYYIAEYSPKILSIEKGSIIIVLNFDFIISASILSILIKHIFNRLKAKNKKSIHFYLEIKALGLEFKYDSRDF